MGDGVSRETATEKGTAGIVEDGSCLAVESDVEGAARSTPQLDHNNRDADTANTAISS